MTINTDLLQRTLEHIEAHPEEWDQTVWACETSACFAGHAVWLSGLATVDDEVTVADGSAKHVGAAAEELLGLTPLQSAELFASGNELDDLRLIVKTLVDAGLTPLQLRARELERAESL